MAGTGSQGGFYLSYTDTVCLERLRVLNLMAKPYRYYTHLCVLRPLAYTRLRVLNLVAELLGKKSSFMSSERRQTGCNRR